LAILFITRGDYYSQPWAKVQSISKIAAHFLVSDMDADNFKIHIYIYTTLIFHVPNVVIAVFVSKPWTYPFTCAGVKDRLSVLECYRGVSIHWTGTLD